MVEKISKKRFRRCILHIGTEKTGTSAIQRLLGKNREVLLAQNILYPSSAQPYGSQWEFIAACHTTPWFIDAGWAFDIRSKEDQETFKKSHRATLEVEFDENSKADTLIISSEHFHSRLTSREMIGQLKLYLGPWVEHFEILVYFRRQDEVAVSFLSTRLKSGVDVPDVKSLPADAGHRRYFEYDLIYQDWVSVFGASSMRPQLYAFERGDDQNLLNDFQQVCGVHGLDQTGISAPNRALGRQAFHLLRYLNAHHPNPPGADRKFGDQEALTRKISNLFPGDYKSISRDEARKFYQMFEDGNERLRQLAFPDMPAPLFGDCFDAYPEVIDDLEPRYADAVEIILKLAETQPPVPQSAGFFHRMKQKLRWVK